MRHATAILIAASLSAAAPQRVASQEPASPPAAVPSPAPAPAAAAPSNVKVAGRDVPAPKRTRFVSPVFPLEAQAAGQRGIVIIEIVIDEAGKVSTADVLRSVPPFDEAALAAARQWEYEITKVDGKPVPVRLTVPITFALKLPDMTREAGIPELRQGATPGFPIGAKGPAKVVADVTLQPDGTVAEAAIKEGDSPYAEAMLLTLRTWRFASEAEAPPVAFQVRAEFVPGPPPRVELKLSGLRTAERRPADTPSAEATPAPPTIAPSPSAVATPAPAPATPAPATPAPADPALATPTPAPATPAPTTTTATPPPPVVNAPPAPLPRPDTVRPSPVVPTPPPVEVIPGGPASQPSPAPGTAAAPGAVPGVPATPPSPAPRSEPGVSAVRDVALGPGVPDLTKGRRPVAPPLARMSSLSGAVQVQFSVDASGSPSIQSVNGPDLLKEAARQAVATWSFRRTSAERLYLVATFNYEGDRAQAEVKRAE
ncbi:MAG TPA: TonB family protein [Vicinamibacteria bacterium]|nr:TonB family protein [Vicinamibacteria bacterium]